MPSNVNNTILILCDKGKIGTLRQCEALAKPLGQHLNSKITYVDVDLPLWFRWLTPHATRHWPVKFLPVFKLSNKPSLIIAAGRQAFLLGAPLAKKIPTIALLNPRCPSDYFTMVILPQHDGVGNHQNVIETLGALHPHSEESFPAGKTKDIYIVTVLLGGNSKHYTYKDADFVEIATYLKKKASVHPNVQLLISPSRRTPQNGLKILQIELADVNATIWDGASTNPYLNYIGSADEILVTGDSISMISEVCYLGKPVEIWKLPIRNKRFLRFYDAIRANKHGVFANDKWPAIFQPLRELERVLGLILKSTLMDDKK